MGNGTVVLLITDLTRLPGTVVLWVLQEFRDKIESGRGLSIITQASNLAGQLGVESSTLDAIVSVSETPGYHSSAWLAEISRSLKAGGVLFLQEPVATRDLSPEEVQRLGQTACFVQTEVSMQRSLLLAGFINSTLTDAVNGLGLAAGYSDLLKPLFSPVAIKVMKPAWEIGSTFSLKKRAGSGQETVPSANGTTGKVSLSDGFHFNMNAASPANGVVSWKVPSVDLEIDELVDEDSLLTDEDYREPEVSLVDDCEVGQAGRKACKNCTCGRAEMEEELTTSAVKLTLGQISNPQSACGSCGLGDAFRCKSCPYKGLPAFKLGEKIALPSAMLTVDV